MPMLRRIIFFINILLSIFLSILPLNGYCDNWVYIGNNEDFTDYYNSSSVKIDKQNKTIEVRVKRVYTEKGKINYKSGDYSLNSILLNYKECKWCITHLTNYSKSGNVLFDDERPPKWSDIKPDSVIDKIINQIIKDYKIQR